MNECTLLRVKFHVPVPVRFFWKKWVGRWKEGGAMCPSLAPKYRYPPWMGVPHFVLCKNGSQRTSGSNNNKKDMCQLESYGDRIGRSPRVPPWVIKASLFFKCFPLFWGGFLGFTVVHWYSFVKGKVHI